MEDPDGFVGRVTHFLSRQLASVHHEHEAFFYTILNFFGSLSVLRLGQHIIKPSNEKRRNAKLLRKLLGDMKKCCFCGAGDALCLSERPRLLTRVSIFPLFGTLSASRLARYRPIANRGDDVTSDPWIAGAAEIRKLQNLRTLEPRD